MLLKRSLTAVAAVFVGVVPVALSAQANGLTGPGTATYVNAQWGFMNCPGINCTPASGAVDNTKTGTGSLLTADTATIQGTGDPIGQGKAIARSELVGPLGTPILKAVVGGEQGFGAPPGYSSPNYFMYGADAIANSVNYYGVTNTTGQPLSFTAQFSFDAFMRAETLASASSLHFSASIWAYDGQGANIELPFGQGLGGTQVSLSGLDADAEGMVSGTQSFTFTVNPGSGFYLLAFLGVSITGYPEGDNLVDAYNTMTVSFAPTNTSALTPVLIGSSAPPSTSVPEPSTWLLMATGLAVIASAERRRRRA